MSNDHYTTSAATAALGWCGGETRGLGPRGTHLVKAARAIDRPVVPWQERDEGLSTALRADRGVHLALTASPTVADAKGSVLLRNRAAARTTLGLVHQALLGVELLLAGGEDEVHPAVSTVDGLVGVHPTLCLLFARHGRALDGLLVPLPGRAFERATGCRGSSSWPGVFSEGLYTRIPQVHRPRATPSQAQ